MIYLDHAATAPPAPEVVAVMNEVHERSWGNPSSMHAAGQRSRRVVDVARDRIAVVLGRTAGELVFTSGGTEANNLAIRGAVRRHATGRDCHVVTTATEHESVLATCEALRDAGEIDLTIVGCGPTGVVDPGSVAGAVRDDTVLVSVMLVNNEVGTINDLAAISAQIRKRSAAALLHTDASQALGRVAVRPGDLGVDLLTLSAHKARGPQGSGALWRRRDVAIAEQQTGGGQERGVRSGTENVAGIAGFGVAAQRAEERRSVEMARQVALAARLREGLRTSVPGLWMADANDAVANIVTVALPDVPSEVAVTALDREGVCVSGGSACSSGAIQPSHVLAAMGVEERYRSGPVRFSLGEQTTADEVDLAVAAVARIAVRIPAALTQA